MWESKILIVLKKLSKDIFLEIQLQTLEVCIKRRPVFYRDQHHIDEFFLNVWETGCVACGVPKRVESRDFFTQKLPYLELFRAFCGVFAHFKQETMMIRRVFSSHRRNQGQGNRYHAFPLDIMQKNVFLQLTVNTIIRS